MKFVIIGGIILICLLCLSGMGMADQVSGAINQGDKIWNGTWESEGYFLYIQQNDSEIKGYYEPFNISSQDPGMLEGVLSSDGRVFSGTWSETGPLVLTLAADTMSYTGAGNVRPHADLNSSGSYTTIGKRVESSFDPEKTWNGSWKTGRTLNTFIQNGATVTGSYVPLPEIYDEPGTYTGTVSEDGTTLLGNWSESGNFSFTISNNGRYWNGTYDMSQNSSVGSDSWNATKVL